MQVIVRYVFLGLILATLLVSMLTLAFNVQPFKAEAEAATTLDFCTQNKWDSLRSEELRNLDWDDDGSAELTVGVNAQSPEAQEVGELISCSGGRVTDTISIDGNIQALAVKVPTDNALLFIQELQESKLIRYMEPDSELQAFYTPNDPHWPEQWGPQKIEADWAWNTTTGSSDILVAIVDTGIDYTHPDLAANYVPLGYDWQNNDADPIDDCGHGTHCAGIVAAQINNSVGIAGLAQVHIMAEKVLSATGSGSDFGVAHGIIHATDQGANIISMSLGGPDYSDVLHDAVKYAYDHGVLLVAAAGNDHSDAKNYPAAYDEVIAVTATDSSDTLAAFSSYGEWVELAAPGVNIYSTMPTYHVTLNDYGYPMNYASLSGTSMACPHVAGVAALAWSINKNFTNAALREYLRRTADDLGYLGFDEYYGYGRVNAKKAATPIPEHDLCITDLRCPHRINPEQPGIFNVTVSNYGTNNETDVSVEFFVNETLIEFKNISFLGIGSPVSLSYSWNTTVIGNYSLTFYAVPVSGENITENNAASAQLQVRFPAVFRVPDEYSTLKEAIGNALEGDTVLVSAGYYAEGQIDIFENDIALIGDGDAILDGQNCEYVLNIEANGTLVEGFKIQNATKYGLKMKGCGNNLTRNDIFNNTDGICLYKSHDSIISLNNVTTELRLVYPWWIFRHCIVVDRSSNNTISSNKLTGGALWLHYSDANFLCSNTVTNSDLGLAISASPNNELRNNVMANNTRNFALLKREADPMPETILLYPWQAFNDIDTSNTVDGKPIYYWVNESNKAVPSDAGCAVMVQCKNINVENLDVKNNLDSILFLWTNDSRIIRNKVTANTWAPYDDYSGGIAALYSLNLNISRNYVTASPQGIWIYNNYRYRGDHYVSQNTLVDSRLYVECVNSVVTWNNLTNSNIIVWGSNSIIAFNNITGDTDDSGIRMGLGSNNTVKANNIVACIYGMQVDWATNCTIMSNNVIGSSQFPVQRYFSSNNIYFHNNFINYTSIWSMESMSYDTWDDGYPSGGNY